MNGPRAPHPTVSVIIATFNRAGLVQQAIASVLSQTFSELELLVVDDASTDDTPSVVQDIDDPRLRYIRLDHNRGGAGARNAGVASSTAPYVAFLDSDDEWRRPKLERQLRVLEESEFRPLFVYSGISFSLADGTRKPVVRRRRGNLFPEFAKDQEVINYRTSSCVWRRDALEVLGGFDERLPARQDWDLACRALFEGPCDVADEVLVDIHTHVAQNRLSRDQGARISAGRYLLEKYAVLDSPYRRHLLAQVSTVLGKDYFLAEDRVTGHRAIRHGFRLAPVTALRSLWPGGLLVGAASINSWTFEQVLSRWRRRR